MFGLPVDRYCYMSVMLTLPLLTESIATFGLENVATSQDKVLLVKQNY